jgi:surface carbohydrate biosynthesis protein
MTGMKTPLLLPAETQIREFDGKLLVACVAAERGIPAVVGSRMSMHAHATALPRGIYVSKDVRSSSLKMMGILERLGHSLCAWDEECLVQFSAQRYYETRVSPEVFQKTSVLCAWGDDNAKVFRDCPSYTGAPIHVTGNPRIDMLRPELRGFFDDDVAKIRDRYGDYILISTHFGAINHYVPQLSAHTLNAITPTSEKGGDFREGLRSHLFDIFQHFEQMIPALGAAFSDRKILVRPHPAENRAPWDKVAAELPNVHVVQEGNVVPWILAAQALVHNSCTTSVEAFALERPAVAYLPVTSDRFDLDLPNALGHRAFSTEELLDALRNITMRPTPPPQDPAQLEILRRNIAGTDGRFAAERIVDALVTESSGPLTLPTPDTGTYAKAWIRSHQRATSKWLKSFIPGHKNNADYQRQRFPGLTAADVDERIQRFSGLLGRFENLRAHRLFENVFEILPS